MVEKTAVFIDLGYLNKITSKHGNLKVDFQKLANSVLLENQELYRIYIYHCPSYQSNPPTDEERLRKSKSDRFINVLKRQPRTEMRLGRLSKKGTSFIQKRVDTYFAIDLVKLSIKNSIKNAVLIAGDSDFVPAIVEAKENDVIVTLYYYRGAVHDELLDSCDEKIEITSELLNSVKRGQ